MVPFIVYCELNEVVVNTVKKNQADFRKAILPNSGNKIDPERDDVGKKIGETSTGHHIYKTKDSRSGLTTYHAYDPVEKRSTIAVRAKEKNGVLNGLYLAAHPKNNLRAHEFYHHLLKHHVTAIVADSQSEGAMRVWSNLSKKRGVKVHGWSNGKPVNVKWGDDTHDDNANDRSPEATEIRKMLLVAHVR